MSGPCHATSAMPVIRVTLLTLVKRVIKTADLVATVPAAMVVMVFGTQVACTVYFRVPLTFCKSAVFYLQRAKAR